MTVAKKPVRAEISFTEDEFYEFVDGQIGFRIVSDEMIDHRRWSVVHEMIIERLEDSTFWSSSHEVGATESQEYDFDSAWGYNNNRAVFRQVFPKTITTTTYA